jgi:two-component system, OmpR family, response regulator VicR
MKIALVEDDKDLSEIFKVALEREGFEVKTAFDGEVGWKLIQKEKPDLVLLDVVMPKKNGFEVLEEMKKLPQTSIVPVIMLSVRNQDDDVKQGLRLGADDYIVKSQHTVDAIVRKVKQLCQESKP